MSQPKVTLEYKVELKFLLEGQINDQAAVDLVRERLQKAFGMGMPIGKVGQGTASLIEFRELDYKFQMSWTGLKEGEKVSMLVTGD